jgi:hypothetical protein
MLVPQQHIMHLPEPVLRRGGFRSVRCGARVRMDLRKRKVTKDEAKHVAQLALDRFDDRVCDAAVYTFEVTVLDHCDGSAIAPLDMISRADRPDHSITAHR